MYCVIILQIIRLITIVLLISSIYTCLGCCLPLFNNLKNMFSTLFQKICSKWTYGCRLYPNIFFTLVYTYSVLNKLVDISKLKKMSHYVHSPRFFASHNENITLESIQFKMIRLNNNNERCSYTDFGGHF